MSFKTNFLIYLAIVALATYTRADDEEDDRMSVKDVAEALMSFGEECDPKPEEEHVIEVVKNVEEPQYISKCFRHCLMVQFEFIQEGAQTMNKEKVVDMMGTMFSERKDDLDQIVDICNEKNKEIAEKCENAHAHGMCLLSEMKERGFDIPELKDE